VSTTLGLSRGGRGPAARERAHARFEAVAKRRLSTQGEAPAASARPKAALALPIAGVAITSAGLVLALFIVYLFAFSGLQAARDQHKLQAELLGGPAGLAALSGTAPADGQPAAVLSIPSLAIHDVVVEGTSAADLQQGPGLMPGTAPVGTLGDTVLAGRQSTFGGVFGSLGRLRAGARITVWSALGVFHYRVTGSSVVDSSRRLAIDRQSSSAHLELVTSRSAFGGGFVVVHADLVGTAVTAPSPALPLPTSSELSLSGDPAAEVPSLLWGEALVAVIVIAILAYRRTRQAVLTYVLTAPVIIVVLLFFFENLSRLLPATI
jgi:sortase A